MDTINHDGKAYIMYVGYEATLQKQPLGDVFQNRCSYQFCNIHRKTPVLESFLNKVAGLRVCDFIKKRLQHRCFPVIKKIKKEKNHKKERFHTLYFNMT